MSLTLRTIVAAAVLLGALTGASSAASLPPEQGAPDSSPAAEMATLCIGRFLVDVPAGSRLRGGTYLYDFFQIEAVEAQPFDAFDSRLTAKETSLQTSGNGRKTKLSWEPLAPDTRLFAYDEWSFLTKAVRIEGHRWKNGASVLLSTLTRAENQDPAMAAAARHLALFRPRADTDIPAEPGYCFAGGFIADDGWHNEEVGIDIALSAYPDATLSIDIFPLVPTLFEPPPDPTAPEPQTAGKRTAEARVLRHGERRIGPFRGRESLLTAREDKDIGSHTFRWEARYANGPLQWVIGIALSTGTPDIDDGPRPTQLSDAQALQLWDRILQSFRIRPTDQAAWASAPRTPHQPTAAKDQPPRRHRHTVQAETAFEVALSTPLDPG